MFKETSNPYSFKYLITGISGNGIEQVYLPEIPPKDQILFKKEQKFVRPEMPEQLKRWSKEYYQEKERNKNFIHAHQDEINRWESQEYERQDNGIFFWNNGEITYITGFYYWMLTVWNPYFGRPTYRETDKEITYWIQFWEEDPDSFGGALNTIRRYGKSTIMGAWIVYRATRNFNHMAGMQGETDKKIAAFYKKFVLRPFYKLPPFCQPTYNMDSKQASKIEFDVPAQRNKKRTQFETEDIEALESMIDFRPSGEGEYDGEILNSYLAEEPGKLRRISLYNEDGDGRWDIVKPCFLQGGEQICGKAFFGTTVENLSAVDFGGQAYRTLFHDSDYNNREADGRTLSGLYAAFLPGDCALKGYIDEWGHPIRDKARESLLRTRKAYEKRPTKLAGWIRKYPMTVNEIFYVNPEKCEFNAMRIQEQLNYILTQKTPLTHRIDFYWENNVRDSKVKWRHAPENGWCQVARGAGFSDIVGNRVEQRGNHPETGVPLWFPKADDFAIGGDPIEHGVVTQPGRASKPVIYVKSKLDLRVDGIDGQLTEDQMEERYQQRYPYKTNKPIILFDKRPTDPNKFFEYAIMICVYFGCKLHVENQKYAIINYFHARGYGGFIENKYRPLHERIERPDKQMDGTASSRSLIQQYTSLIARQKEYFCHLNPFREVLEDNLIFNPNDTKIHDYTVAEGFAELQCEMTGVKPPEQLRDITDFFHTFDRRGRILS